MRCIVAVVLGSLFVACAMPRVEREAAAGERESKHPNGIYQRAQARRSADGDVPHDALMRASEHKGQMAMLDDLGAPVQWTWLGPGNIGGRLRAVLIDPNNTQRLWVGSAGGGVWYSDNGGASWAPRNGLLTMLGCGCMALDPANSDHLYFGSGEGFFDAVEGTHITAILRGAGLFESFDAGVTWSRIASTAVPAWYFINRLAFQPGNPLVMMAATGSGIWRSTDGGQTWNQRTTTRTFDLRWHPTDPLRAVAGRADGIAQWTADGGLTWNNAPLNALATRIELAYARSNPNTVFATVSDTASGIHVWRSTDGGQIWLRTSSSTISTYSLYNNCLWVDPTNENNLVFGGVQIYRSTNAGATRTQISTGAHADYHVIVEHPGFNGTTNKRIYTGNDGGLHTRTDWQAGSWTALNTGLGVTQFYGAAMNPTSGIMVAGAQDNGTSRYTLNPAVWVYNVIGGDGGFAAADQLDPNYFYGGYQNLGLNRSSNGGVNWTDIRGLTVNDAGFNFIPYFLLDPNNQSRMLACGRSLWRTNNVKTGAPTWTQIKAPRTCPSAVPIPNDHFGDNPYCNHSFAQIARGNSDIIWAAHNDGELHRTSNGTAASPTWTLVESAVGGQLPDRWINCIEIDPSNHSRVLVSLMGYTPDNLWETLDNGVTWHTIDGSGAGALPELPVSWIIMHPVLHDLLFVATDLGVFHSTDGGANWAPLAGGPENVCIEQLIWKNDRTLLVVTHGRGVYQATLPLAGTMVVGTGCAVATPPVLAATSPVIGVGTTFSMAAAAPNALVFFAVNFGGPVSVPLGGCTVHVDLPNAHAYITGSTSGTGAWSHPLALPLFSSLIGAELTAQTLLLGTGGPMFGIGDLSTGLHLFLGL